MSRPCTRSFEFASQFKFYEELNDFLPADRQDQFFSYLFNGSPSIKDPIEAIGVPHTEVDLIAVNGRSVGFEYRLQYGDSVQVYPVGADITLKSIVKLRDEPLRKEAFILDVHLGKLARMLRMLGFDTIYEIDYDDPEIVRRALLENRIIITRDRLLLHAKIVTHGYCIRSTDSEEQLREVLDRFDLYSRMRPFYRCMICNCKVRSVEKSEILHRLEPKTILYYDKFFTCEGCRRIYWQGSHHERLKDRFEKICQFREDKQIT
ncbi:MAG: Mut7-C ubiquitin/RNAse domain-containing protein [Candidatus Brocadiales bacterium]|nr:Mut7-C ubiquitin/RNAse domain-containing protein [Candidatus Brocadiales bacterium]